MKSRSSAGAKQRLDIVVSQRGLTQSLAHARALIMAGRVLVDEVKVDKPGTLIAVDDPIRLLGDDPKYVSRGGLKLAHALRTFALSVTGKRAMDVGASTGGFTDCLLQAGAREVIAVDVGYGQLAQRLRTDARVKNLERTNIRTLDPALVAPVALIVIDASFISLRLVLPAALRFLDTTGEVIALVKPQFEVGKAQVGKGGVVRDPDLHAEVISAMQALAGELGLKVCGLTPSPITGQKKGNVEFLLWAKR